MPRDAVLVCIAGGVRAAAVSLVGVAAIVTLSLDAWTSGAVIWIVALGAPVALFAILAALLDTPTAVGSVVRAVGRWLYQ